MSVGSVFDPGLNTRWRSAVDDHKRHAFSEWPREACGLIDEAGKYHACENVAEDKMRHFRISRDQLLSVNSGRPTAVLHSHTSLPDPVTNQTREPLPCPSAADMRGQINMAVPWGITLCTEQGASDPFWFGDQVPRPPLWGRSFRHGVDDCYSLIRDWYALVPGIKIPDFPRDQAWWDPREDGVQVNLYEEGFEKAGFQRVDRSDRKFRPGDVFLTNVRSPVMNHGGVFVTDQTIGHHLMHLASIRAAAVVWQSRLNFIVRHRELPEDWSPPNDA